MFPYKRLLRPLLFSLPPERAHQLGEFALRMKYLWSPLAPYYKTRDPALKTSLAGIQLDSPVGVAAGCDKNLPIPQLAYESGLWLRGGRHRNSSP